MKFFNIFALYFMVLFGIVLSKNTIKREECACRVNKNEIDPVIPCLSNPSESTQNGCVPDMSELNNMNNKTCLAYLKWSSIQQFMRTCTNIKSEQEYAQWVVSSICPDLDKKQNEKSRQIAELCVNFDADECLCRNNLYEHKDLYSCFRKNETTFSQNTCKEHGWLNESSAIYNINYKFLPIVVFALFATFFF